MTILYNCKSSFHWRIVPHLVLLRVPVPAACPTASGVGDRAPLAGEGPGRNQKVEQEQEAKQVRGLMALKEALNSKILLRPGQDSVLPSLLIV